MLFGELQLLASESSGLHGGRKTKVLGGSGRKGLTKHCWQACYFIPSGLGLSSHLNGSNTELVSSTSLVLRHHNKVIEVGSLYKDGFLLTQFRTCKASDLDNGLTTSMSW